MAEYAPDALLELLTLARKVAAKAERHTALLTEIRDALRALAKDRAFRGG